MIIALIIILGFFLSSVTCALIFGHKIERLKEATQELRQVADEIKNYVNYTLKD